MGPLLRVVSANLWNGRADAQAFADLVLALAADVVAVQELAPDQAEALARALPHGELEPARDHNGMGIALRRPAVHSKIELYRRPARVATLSPEGWPQLERPVEIVNLHIAAPHLLFPYFGLGARRIQMRNFDAHFADVDDAARVLVGDFNSTPLWPAYKQVASQFTDAAVAVAELRGRSVEPTWGPMPGFPRVLRIDHGFIRGLRAEAFQVVGITGSDHGAIVMDLAFP